MRRIVVRMCDGQYINIPADRMFQDANFLYIYKGENPGRERSFGNALCEGLERPQVCGGERK